MVGWKLIWYKACISDEKTQLEKKTYLITPTCYEPSERLRTLLGRLRARSVRYVVTCNMPQRVLRRHICRRENKRTRQRIWILRFYLREDTMFHIDRWYRHLTPTQPGKTPKVAFQLLLKTYNIYIMFHIRPNIIDIQVLTIIYPIAYTWWMCDTAVVWMVLIYNYYYDYYYMVVISICVSEKRLM